MSSRTIRRVLHASVLVACAMLPAISLADILHVPADFPTIQAAIDAAADGDEIVVGPGTYDPFELRGGIGLTITGSAGAAATVVDAGGASPVCSAPFGMNQPVVLRGLTLTNGTRGVQYSSFTNPTLTVDQCIISNITSTGRGAAIGNVFNSNGNFTITDTLFVGNSTTEDGGALAFVGISASFTVTGCTFEDNSSALLGGAIYDPGGSSQNRQISGCTFQGNTAAYGGAIASLRAYDDTFIQSSEFIGNTATEANGGGAIYLSQPAPIVNCEFSGNSALSGPGGGARAVSATFTDCTFTDNEALTGGALSLDAGSVTGCTFTQNTATTDGGAVVCGDITVTGSIFTSNAASGKGGAAHAAFGQPTFADCEMSMNDATATGGGIYVEDLAILSILDSTLCMNTPDQFAFEGALLASNVFGCDIPCPESEPVGACCLNDGSCVELTQATCDAVGGTYQGDDSLCADASCPAPCFGDANNDGVIDLADLNAVLAAFGQVCP